MDGSPAIWNPWFTIPALRRNEVRRAQCCWLICLQVDFSKPQALPIWLRSGQSDPADAFEIGSITKLFTAVVLLQLHEEGLLSLDDKLSMWLPELAETIPNGEAMTLLQLASHTAGINDYERDLYPLQPMINDRALLERGFTPVEIVEWVAANKAPFFAPGTPGAWQYSNTGYIVLGMVLEGATDQRLGELYAAHFRTLGTGEGSVAGRYSRRWPDRKRLQCHERRLCRHDPLECIRRVGSQALAMSAGDLAIFAHALMDGLLFQDVETLGLMTDFVSTGQDRGFTGYGLGLAQLQGGVWGHAGGTPGFGSSLVIDPKRETVVVFLGNSGSFNVNPMELASLPLE